jgi:Chitobiase/beta-hexosaminidase C-terminal domain
MAAILNRGANALCLWPRVVERRLQVQGLFDQRVCGVLLGSCLLTIALLALTGCEKPSFTGPLPAFFTVHGSVQGGQHPISGSTIQVYSAGTTGRASSALPLLSQPTHSDSNGNFSLTIACPSGTSQLYITAREGNPGSGPGVVNPAIALMAALGSCDELTTSPSVTVNEVTTVGSIWPLASYMSSATLLGYSPGDRSFSAAVTLVQQLVDASHGTSPGQGVPQGYVVQTAKLDSLADLLDACVNSFGGTAGDGSACGLLFSLGAVHNATPPTDTLQAALLIAQAPDANVTNIFNLVPGGGAYQPTISASPVDWSLPLVQIPGAPVIDPSSGNYPAGQQVTLTDNIPGAVIHYTTDGSAPSSSSAVYTSPIALANSETVRAIAVDEGVNSSTSSASYTVTPAHLVFSTQPSSTPEGSAISPAPAVSMIDSNGNRVAGAQNPIKLSISPGGALSGSTTVPAVQGVATFSNLAILTPGSGFTLTASSPGLVSSTSAPFRVISSSNANSLGISFSLPGSSINVGSTMRGSVTLGAPAGAGGVNVTLVSSASKDVGISPSLLTIAAGQSTGSFTLSALAPGTSTLTATAGGYNPASTQVLALAVPPAPPTPPAPNGPTVTTIEPLGAITASQAVNGLGFNVSQGNDWEFKMAAAAGATHARYQCSWVSTENQTPPPENAIASPQFSLESDCQAGLASAANYGIHSTIVAAYGSPFHQILTVTVPNGAPAGAKTLNVQFATGTGGDTLASMAPFYDTILSSSKAAITSKHSYGGGLIIGVALQDATHATLTLASGLSSALPTNTSTQYVVNEYLYPPPQTFSPTDPSVLAYARYAEFLASKISASGVSGEVEIWNEPPWSDDPWDDRYDFYDVQPVPVSPGPKTPYLPNWGFAVAIQAQTSPAAGVTYNWGGTEKSGGNSMLNPQMLANTGVLFHQPNSIVTTESFHPYGNNPEDELWNEPCLEATVKIYPAFASNFANCNLVGVGPNSAYAVQLSLLQKAINPSWGIGHNITETGFEGDLGDEMHKARFTMRQFLGYQAAGVTPIEFYRLYDTSTGNFSFVNPTANPDGTHSPLPAYTAVAGLMTDLAKIKQAPVTPYSTSNLPAIASYSGTYPLDTVSLVGARAGDTANSVFFAIWQRSNTGGTWGTLSSPVAAPVTVNIPSGLAVAAVVNMDTRATVPYTTSGQQLTLSVSDDPVEVLLEPTN